jgi:hypothetical protein
MPSKLYKILRVQIGETEGTNNRRHKQTLDVGRIIKHEANGNEWMSVQIDAAHLGPVLYQLAKPYMRKGSGSVDVSLHDPPMRRSVPAVEEPPLADAPEAED